MQDERVDPSADDNYAMRLAAERGHIAVIERLLQDKRVDPSADDNYVKAISRSSNDCWKTSALIRRPTTITPRDGLLVKATSRSSIACCKTSASIRRPGAATRSDRLLGTATSRSSIGCSKVTALTLLSLFNAHSPKTANDSSVASALPRSALLCRLWSCRRGSPSRFSTPLVRGRHCRFTANGAWCARSNTFTINATPSSSGRWTCFAHLEV
jgi:hypothetical protein